MWPDPSDARPAGTDPVRGMPSAYVPSRGPSPQEKPSYAAQLRWKRTRLLRCQQDDEAWHQFTLTRDPPKSCCSESMLYVWSIYAVKGTDVVRSTLEFVLTEL